MSEKEFTYDRIDMDRPSFRLIRLLGGSTTHINCELFEAYLDEANDGGIPYDALSYTWGGIEKNATIQINDMKARVTENLFMALHHLRSVDNDRILWIDAVCIDQGDDKEKGHQVQQMGDIYQKAELVIVWLGTGTQDSDDLMDFLRTLPLKAEVPSASQLVPRHVQVRYSETMEKLLDRPWFRRIWVIQEVAKARRAIIACGWKSVSTRIFTNATSLLGLEPDLHSKAILDVMPGHLRARNWYNQQPTLYTLLQNFHRSETTDKRDMIYALLSMSSSVYERSKLQADYGKDLRELIRDTVSTLLFPGRTESPDLYYIDWDWSEFIDNLKDLRNAAFLCALKHPTSEPQQFIDINWDGPNWNDFTAGYRDGQGRTVLRIAAEYGHGGIVTALLQQDGIDINTQDENGVTPLQIAAQQGHKGVVRLLVEQDGIDINAKVGDGNTLLHIAAQEGHEGVARLLVEQDGIDINAKDKRGKTPLQIAAQKGQQGVARLLVEQDGIDINSRDNSRKTPLQIAAQQGHESIVRLLVEQDGIDTNAKDKDGITPLQIAARWSHESVMRLLIEQDGIDINAKDNRGVTPLQIAARQGHEGIVRLLVEQDGIDINVKDKDGVTPMQIAARLGHEGIVRLLVKSVA
jgi:ankyrin repeat protein